MTGSVIDMNVYQTLLETVGDDFIAEMVEAFLEEGAQFLTNLNDALGGQDLDRFRRAAHSLKSNAATFGAMQLSKMAGELENMARANQLDGANEKLEPVASAFREAEQALKDLQDG